MQSFKLKFLGVTILQGGGRISHFPIDFCMGLTTVQRYCAACDGDIALGDVCLLKAETRDNASMLWCMLTVVQAECSRSDIQQQRRSTHH